MKWLLVQVIQEWLVEHFVKDWFVFFSRVFITFSLWQIQCNFKFIFAVMAKPHNPEMIIVQ